MSLALPFYIADVFGESTYTRNQLAVFTNARSLADDEMQSIAKEMNYSETTFILSDRERDGGVRRQDIHHRAFLARPFFW